MIAIPEAAGACHTIRLGRVLLSESAAPPPKAIGMRIGVAEVVLLTGRVVKVYVAD